MLNRDRAFRVFLNLLALVFLFTPGFVFANDYYSVQAGSFTERQGADKLLEDLRRDGADCKLLLNGRFFKVLCGHFDSKEEASSVKKSLYRSGYGDTYIVRFPDDEASASQVEAFREQSPAGLLIDKAINQRPIQLETYSDVPTSEGNGISGDILGRRGGHVHPFLLITEVYTDNLFNTSENKVEDYETIVSPGIWIAVPRKKERMEWDDAAVLIPGGRAYNKVIESDRRYQLHVLYRADIERFRDSKSEDFDHHRAGGQLQVSSKGGFSLNLSEQYVKSHGDRGTGMPGGLDEFRMNDAGVIISYDFSKLKLRSDYTSLLVDYRKATSDFKDREDNVASVYVFYEATPKTSLFAQYEYIDIRYDENVLPGSHEQNYFAGVEWDVTAKSTGMIKFGYGVRVLDASSGDDDKEFVLAGSLKQKFTPKTSLIVEVIRKREETDIQGAGFVLANRIRANWSQRFSRKVSGTLSVSYADRTYEPALTFGGETKNRKDNHYGGMLAFKYEFLEWLFADIGYSYEERKSTFSFFDYTTNKVFFRVGTDL